MNTLYTVGLTAALLASPAAAEDPPCLVLAGEALNVTVGENDPGFVYHSTLAIVNSCSMDVTSRIRLDPVPKSGIAPPSSLRTIFSASGVEILDAGWRDPAVSPVSVEIPAGTTVELNLRTHLIDDGQPLASGDYRADFAVDWLPGAPAAVPSEGLGATGVDIFPGLGLGAAAAAAGGLLLILGRSRSPRRMQYDDAEASRPEPIRSRTSVKQS